MELLKLLLATGNEDWDEKHKKEIAQMIRHKLEKLGAPQITDREIA
jgi:DNA repair protein RadC